MAEKRFSEVVKAVAAQIASGDLPAGSRLPTQRQLADQFHVAPATANRVYQELRRQGLAIGEIGRGTFVRGPAQPPGEDFHGTAHPGRIDLGMNAPILEGQGELFRFALTSLMDSEEWTYALRYQPPEGREQDRAAATRWFASRGIASTPNQVLITCGAQHALYIALVLLCRPGDIVAVEEHTYPGLKILAGLHHLTLAPLPMDSDGLLPDALERACRLQNLRALYCMPTIHNPRGCTMPDARRREIVDICLRHRVFVIEDDSYAFLDTSGPSPLQGLAPDACINIQSMSKAFAPGLRIGFMVLPERCVPAAKILIRSTTWTANAMMSAMITHLIDSGEMTELVKRKRADAAARQALARSLLPPTCLQSHPTSYHAWVRLPDGVRADDVTRHLDTCGVAVSSGTAFTAVERDVSAGIRLALGSPSMERLADGLTIVADTLAATSQPQIAEGTLPRRR